MSDALIITIPDEAVMVHVEAIVRALRAEQRRKTRDSFAEEVKLRRCDALRETLIALGLSETEIHQRCLEGRESTEKK